MKINKIIHLLIATSLLSTSVSACTVPQNDNVQGNRSTSGTALASSQQKTATERPETKTTTITVEGEPVEVPLRLYEIKPLGFSTYYPEDYFSPDIVGSGEGTGIMFLVNTTGTPNPDASVRFNFLNDIDSLGQLRQFVNDPNGLIALSGWNVTDRTTSQLPYSWAREQITFEERQGDELFLGNIFLGQSGGKAFYVVTRFPAEYGDGFSPRANIILENLQLAPTNPQN